MRIVGAVARVVSVLVLLMAICGAQSAPQISGVSQPTMPVGGGQIIYGVGFGDAQGTSTLTLNGTEIVPWFWSDSQLNVTIPSTATPGPSTLQVTTTSGPGNVFDFSLTPPPSITNISPASGPVGTRVTLTGTNFGATQGSSFLGIGPAVNVVSWSDTQIVFTVPSGATVGQQTVWLLSTLSSQMPTLL